MPRWIKSYVRIVEAVNYRIGRFAMYLLFVMMAILLWSSITKELANPAIWTLELAQFEDSEFYDKLTRARREASSRPLSLVNRTFGLGQNLISLVSYAILLVQFSPWAVLILVLAGLPSFVAETRFSGEAFTLFRWRSPETRMQIYLETVIAQRSGDRLRPAVVPIESGFGDDDAILALHERVTLFGDGDRSPTDPARDRPPLGRAVPPGGRGVDGCCGSYRPRSEWSG